MKNFIKIPASYWRYFYKKCTKKENSLNSYEIEEKIASKKNIKSHSCVQEMIRLDSLNTRINLYKENPDAFKKKSPPYCDLNGEHSLVRNKMSIS